MKFPNWFRAIWWLLLVSILSFFLWRRYPELVAGHASHADIVVFVIWLALLLAPLFSEISMFGVTLKQQIEELKGYVSSQIMDVKSEIKSAVDIRATISPHFNIPMPAADAQLPEIERSIKVAVADALAEHGVQQPPPPANVYVPQDVTFLFSVRHNLEKELRRIGTVRQLTEESRRPMSILYLTRALIAAELLEPRLAAAIREVYSVCSPAIHGEPVTEAQMSFVKDVGPDLIAALRAIT